MEKTKLRLFIESALENLDTEVEGLLKVPKILQRTKRTTTTRRRFPKKSRIPTLPKKKKKKKRKKKTKPPQGEGWEKSPRGAWRKKSGDKWIYWYP